ncbi:hypothetical protein FOZ63_004660 [Perkinsus olseni]|uniref:GMP synthase [glutamine-hydrolyzing] n=1 Tax=Perkinsus olseni TaxID=32597 RepID=A0A7J6PDB5_PEROL|nr:hypothetical protein FOZ63_004660 [Perkinsus olseni]
MSNTSNTNGSSTVDDRDIPNLRDLSGHHTEEGLEVSEGLSRILVLDFGSQFSHLICRRCRDIGVYSELRSCLASVDEIKKFGPAGVILSGGPSSVYDEGSPHLAPGVWEWIDTNRIPVLGICYGMQEMVYTHGGTVEPGKKREYGHAVVHFKEDKKRQGLFTGIDGNATRVWMSHGDKVTKLPEGFEIVGSTDTCEHAVIQATDGRKMFGIQFHPEVTHSVDGAEMLRAFAVVICGCKPQWNMQNFVHKELERIKRVVGDKHVIAAVSGGVDSSVAAALVYKALGDKFHPFLVDTGLLRKNEASEVKERLDSHLPGLNLQVLDASDDFMTKLKDVKEPEKKRKIIGGLFIDSFEKAINNMNLDPADCVLLQGTLYPDVIESTSYKGPSSTIKTHHNVGGLPARMKMQILEPLRLLFKDEVRKLGLELGLHADSVNRHPFPGPGLAIRIIDSVDKEKADLLREADAIYMEELHASGEYDNIGQAFAVLLPTVRSVGVMGDQRTYERTLVLRAVQTTDFMTADWYQMPYDLLGRISTRIINECKGINRVVYDVSSKPPATIEWE